MQAQRVLNLETFSVYAKDLSEETRKRRYDELKEREKTGETLAEEMTAAQKRLRDMRQTELADTLAYFNVDYPALEGVRYDAILAMRPGSLPIDLKEHERVHFKTVLPAVKGRIRSLMQMVCMCGNIDAVNVCKSCQLNYCDDCMDDDQNMKICSDCQFQK